MSNFRYRGRSGRGELITGRLEADNIDAVALRLAQSRHHSARDLPGRGRKAPRCRTCCTGSARGRPSTADLVLFSRQMYSITKVRPAAAARTARTRAVDAQRAAARRSARRAAEPRVGPRLRLLAGAPSRALLAAVHQHGAGRRIDRYARQFIPAAVRVPEPGSGRAGPRQERGALPADRGRRDRARDRRDHHFRDPELRAALQGAGQRHSLADARHHGHARIWSATMASRSWSGSFSAIFAFRRHISDRGRPLSLGPLQAQAAGARRTAASVGPVAGDPLARRSRWKPACR